MDNLEFIKFLTTYGISVEEYQKMDDEKKRELSKKFKAETKSNDLENIGKGLQGLGCLIVLIPILIIMIYFIFSMFFN